jgi:2-polyprenyl-6-hydroxyphenyl methylase/3-demethylubiquinone-9 3-methyltransferase
MTTAFYERYWAHRKGTKLDDFDYKWPFLAGYIPREEGARIVDLGCGSGEVIAEMMKLNPGACFTGLDVAETALDLAGKTYPQARFHKITDGGRFPFDDASVDFLFASEVIEHIYDTGTTFSEISRVLVPGGRLLLTTPYHGLVKNLLIVLFLFDRHFDPRDAHVRFFTKKSLFACLEAVGLVPEEHRYYGRFYPLSRTLLVLARKMR